MVADRRKTTHVLECRDADVEQFLLELDAVPVNERQTAVVLKVDRCMQDDRHDVIALRMNQSAPSQKLTDCHQ